MSQQIVRPVNEIDPTDLALNWEIYECPDCGGQGGIFNHYDGCTEFCDNCNGTGELGLYEKDSNGWDDPNNPSFDDLGMLKTR